MFLCCLNPVLQFFGFLWAFFGLVFGGIFSWVLVSFLLFFFILSFYSAMTHCVPPHMAKISIWPLVLLNLVLDILCLSLSIKMLL